MKEAACLLALNSLRKIVGIFSSFFGITIEHRKVGEDAKNYVLRIDLSELDKQVIDLLEVDRSRFVIERQFLLIGLLRSLFGYFERMTRKEEVEFAKIAFEKNLSTYFSTLPGISVEAGYAQLASAYQYSMAEKEILAAIFLERVSDNRYSRDDLVNVPGLMTVIEIYYQDAIRQVDGWVKTLR